MSSNQPTRRKFIGDSVKMTAGVVACATAASQGTAPAMAEDVETSKILNYNDNMEYRRQGSTDLMFSAVCLGGHSRSNVKQRTEIVSRCIDAGIN